ncbi:hypothetical protein F5146DRAFT_1222514 [Armillaria mellea]|nr:hypothetical protein F5146DRAFT_1222514 [Armillaria mellea]
MVAHLKATDILQDVYADRNDKYTESTSKDSRWNELINSLTQYNAPHMYLPESPWHAYAHFQFDLTLQALLRLTSAFWRHGKMLQEKPIPWDSSRPLITALQPEPVAYQPDMQSQIILVVMLADQSYRDVA